MRTVPTLCASGLGCSISALGLVVVRPDGDPITPSRNSRLAPPKTRDMTAVATTYTLSADPRPTFPLNPARSANNTPQTRRLLSREEESSRARSSSARVGQKRSLTPQHASAVALERSSFGGYGVDASLETPIGSSQTWLRRLSSSVMSRSRDSSRAPASRPASAAISYDANGSITFSNTDSTVPIFPDPTLNTPNTLPNKLVKRSTSLRRNDDSPSPSSASKLPLPVFRRPATSHQRTATLQERFAESQRSSVTSHGNSRHDVQWRQYFTPRIAAGEFAMGRRRNSTGIPNPIKRVYPDRRYIPTLISAKDMIRAAVVELDYTCSDDDEDEAATDDEHEGHAHAFKTFAPSELRMPNSAASSPMMVRPSQFEQTTSPRRSFSIGDLLSIGPQPLWKRPLSGRDKVPASKASRRGRARVASAPLSSSTPATRDGPESDGIERPAKRRDITDPHQYQRSIYSASSGTDHRESLQLTGQDGSEMVTAAMSDISTTSRNQSRTPSSALSMAVSSVNERLSSGYVPNASTVSRSDRTSMARSDLASTVGSDSEYKPLDDTSTDYQSDNLWDSIPTRTTRSSSGRRGPHIENIFDESPPAFSSGRSTKLRDLLNDGSARDDYNRHRHSTIEEEGSVLSTPVRSIQNHSVTSTPSAMPRQSQIFSSSPPTMRLLPDPDEIDWEGSDDDEPDARSGLGIQSRTFGTPMSGYTREQSLPFRFGPTLRPVASSHATPQRGSLSPTEKTNLFDWAEQQPSPSHANNSPPRPRTVHGKKDQDSRGSRAAGRRAPSGMHARSHSVPVVPEMDGKRNNVIANKFGTWGVGSKAVTEDWNEDFEFDEPTTTDTASPDVSHTTERRIDSGHEMFVPRSIREQQQNVVAHIGLLREWGLLIEELKDLRVRAVALDMLSGQYEQDWREVDAMIELADQESEEHTLEPRRSPPSSPGFDASAFEDFASPSLATATSALTLTPLPESRFLPRSPVSPPLPSPTQHTSRPRKDSELVARTVIAALQAKRVGPSSSSSQVTNGDKKVPFDTATLRHIVPYVNGLKRKVKDALREKEGLYTSPRRRSPGTSPAMTRGRIGGPSQHDDEGDEENWDDDIEGIGSNDNGNEAASPFRGIFDRTT